MRNLRNFRNEKKRRPGAVEHILFVRLGKGRPPGLGECPVHLDDVKKRGGKHPRFCSLGPRGDNDFL